MVSTSVVVVVVVLGNFFHVELGEEDDNFSSAK